MAVGGLRLNISVNTVDKLVKSSGAHFVRAIVLRCDAQASAFLPIGAAGHSPRSLLFSQGGSSGSHGNVLGVLGEEEKEEAGAAAVGTSRG